MNKYKPTTWGITAVVVIFAVWMIAGLAPYALTTILPRWGWNWLPSPEPSSGIIGDMFGMANALFSAFAILGVIATLYLQIVELRENRAEYKAMVSAQQDSAKTALLAARLNSLQFTEKSLSDLIATEELSIKSFIEARNRLRVASHELDSIMRIRSENEIIVTRETFNFKDDEFALRAEELLNKARMLRDFILSPSFEWDGHNQTLNHDPFKQAISDIKFLLPLVISDMMMLTAIADSCSFVCSYKSKAPVTVKSLQTAYAWTSDKDSKFMIGDFSSANILDQNQFNYNWNGVLRDLERFLVIFREQSIAWAKLGDTAPPTINS